MLLTSFLDVFKCVEPLGAVLLAGCSVLLLLGDVGLTSLLLLLLLLTSVKRVGLFLITTICLWAFLLCKRTRCPPFFSRVRLVVDLFRFPQEMSRVGSLFSTLSRLGSTPSVSPNIISKLLDGGYMRYEASKMASFSLKKKLLPNLSSPN